MATIKLKRSSTPTSVPASLEVGELAANVADGKLYLGGLSGVIDISTGGVAQTVLVPMVSQADGAQEPSLVFERNENGLLDLVMEVL